MGERYDSCGVNGGLYDNRPEGEMASERSREESAADDRLSGCDRGSSSAFRCEIYGSNASLTNSEGGVIFHGADSRLSFFGAERILRPIPSVSVLRRSWGGAGPCGLFDLAREKCSADLVYATVLGLLCVVILLVLILDR